MTEDFAADAREAFAWLNTIGFCETGSRSSQLGAVLTLSSEDRFVEVSWEVRDSYLQVEFGPLVDGAPPEAGINTFGGRTVRYPLWLLLWMATGNESLARTCGNTSEEADRSVRVVLEELSKHLRRLGTVVLTGSDALFGSLDAANRQRIQANIEHRSWGPPPPLPDATP